MSHGLAIRRTLLAAGTLLAAVSVSACNAEPDTKAGGNDANFVTSEGGISTVANGKRKSPGDLTGETLAGKPLDVADLKGKVVVLNVWGSWCPPCRAEAPYFVKVANDLKTQDVEFVGINTRDFNKQQALAFEENFEVPYPSLYDPHGKLIIKGFPKGTLNPNGIPSTIVLDREGRVAARALQALDEKKLRSMIDPLVAER
ncbi:TlpA family protein disulfide reductase [Streptomyces sp. NPDC003023]|uniref:TlpA family protein disulfide reductase n=1 Tax=Streptomyces sp. NPDC003023 TaxID=3364675 RepID=UPI0036BCAA54